MGPRLKLPKFIHAFVDRHGKPRYYYRRPGFKAAALPGLPYSPEFMAKIEEAAAQAAPVEIGASRTGPGTIAALVVAYYNSEAWTNLSADTRRNRRRYIERFREEHGDKRVALLQRHHVEKMLAAIPKVTVRQQWLIAIKALLQAAVPLLRKDNPAGDIPHVKLPKSKGHHTWTDDQIDQYRLRWPLGTQQRLVLEFALETTSRRGEVVRLGPQHVRNGRIRIERTKGSRDVDIPMTPELQAACEAMPKQHLTYIVTSYGKPRSKYGLGTDFAKWATEAGLPKQCRLHGLKKGGMRRLAEAGATTHMIMAVSGHRTLKEIERYTEAADKLKLAEQAMELKERPRNKRLANLQPKFRKPGRKAI